MVTLHRYSCPDDLMAIIHVLEEYSSLSGRELVSTAENLGYIIRDKKRFEDTRKLAEDLNLVEKKKNTYMLTDKGLFMYEIVNRKPDLFADVIHGLQVTLWTPSNKDTSFSWSYREVCRILWSRGYIDKINTREIASEIAIKAKEVFGETASFSPKSVNGVLFWLEKLNPSVLVRKNKEKSFKRRNFCPPELFVLAIDYLYKNRYYGYGSNLLLTDKVQEEICYMCLIEIDKFDKVLEYTTKQFDFVESGVGGGWGRYLVLHRKPELRDFV